MGWSRDMGEVRFSIQLSWASSRDEWVRTARQAEYVGYDSIVIADHVSTQFAPFAALGSLAVATDSIRLGTYVLATELRNPVQVVHELLTLDVLSSGRLDVGLGSGWKPSDFAAVGVPVSDPASRLQRFEQNV